jgi:hypothetical protein
MHLRVSRVLSLKFHIGTVQKKNLIRAPLSSLNILLLLIL